MRREYLIGKTCGKFAIRAELGHGGMGCVYQAYQHDLDRMVAIKILRPELTHEPKAIQRFLQEARSAAKLEHSHIVPIYEVGTLPPPPELPTFPPLHAIVMKYIDGKNLQQVVQQQPSGTRLPYPQILDILVQVGEALDYAHRQQFIHRDIKPSNIMVTKEGWVYLTDFGLAQSLSHPRDLTGSGTIFGTPEYLSPEQVEGKIHLGPASDLYALGIVAYELLSGTLPFEADTPMGMAIARLTHPPRPLQEVCPAIPSAVSQVVMRALARDPKDRFPGVREMITALQRAFMSDPTMFPPAPPVPGPAIGPTIALSPPPPSTPQSSERARRHPRAGPHPPADSLAHARKQRRMVTALVSLPLLTLIVIAGLLLAPISGTLFTPTPTISPVVLTPATPGEEELLDRAWAAFDRGEFEQAGALFAQILGSSHTPAVMASASAGLGWVLCEQEKTAQDYQAALDRFKTSLELSKRDPERNPEGAAIAHNGMGWCLYNMRDYPHALEHFEQATKLAPNYANAYYGKGRTLEELKRLPAAEAAYQEVIKLEPEGRDARDAQNGLDRIRAH